MVAVEMGSWGCSGQEWRKGPWTPEENKVLVEYVRQHGEGRWSCVSKCTGLSRSGKSCRLRWVNYLRPGLKKGHITPQEEGIIIELHALWGNKWSTIARYLPGRTDNEIKNYWRTHFKKRKPSSHDDDQNQSRDKRSSRTLAHKQGKDDMNIIEASPSPDHHHQETEATMNGKEDKKETDILETSNIENPQSMLPMIMQHDYSWSDFIPVDNYNLWGGGLWNQVDDQNGCSKMAIQNQVNVASNSRNGGGGGGDAINYMHNGGFIF